LFAARFDLWLLKEPATKREVMTDQDTLSSSPASSIFSFLREKKRVYLLLLLLLQKVNNGFLVVPHEAHFKAKPPRESPRDERERVTDARENAIL